MRYFTAIVIFVVLIIAISLSFFYCQEVTGKILDLTQVEIDQVITQEVMNLQQIEEIQTLWSNRLIFLSSIAPHDKLNDVTITISECLSWATTDDTAEYLAALTNLKSYVSIIRQLDLPSFSMIF